jgi:hypothetical protein
MTHMLALEAGRSEEKARTPAGGPPARQLVASRNESRGAVELAGRVAGASPGLSETVKRNKPPEDATEGLNCQRRRYQRKAEFGRKFARLRRAKGAKWASCEMLVPVGSPSEAVDAHPDGSKASDGISAFVAKVLDQLALSAWLPAAFLTVSLAALLQFRSMRSANLLNAVRQLTKDPVQVLVIMIPLLIIATVVTQAFSFEAIRMLEGYWRGRGPISFARTSMIWLHVHRKKRITNSKYREYKKALRAAMPELILYQGVPVEVFKAIETELTGGDQDFSSFSNEQVEMFANAIKTWRYSGNAWRLEKVDRLLAEEKCYPRDSRILPTKLGNLIRATEDELTHSHGDVQSFVLRQRDTVSRRVQMQHDQFRTRLEMYCTLVFVSGFLSILTPITLIGRTSILAISVIAASFAAMCAASYLAAIASAGGYCAALRQMDVG